MRCLTVDIAGIRLKLSIETESEIPYVFLKKYLHGFISPNGVKGRKEADCTFRFFLKDNKDIEGMVDSGDGVSLMKDGVHFFYDPSTRRASLKADDISGYIYLHGALYLLFSLALASDGGCLFHGAGLVEKERGYLFIGPSGAGKTTLAGLAGRETAIGDEAIALRMVDNHYTIYPTPFGARDVRGLLPEGLPEKKAKLSHVYVLKQDRKDYTKRLGFNDAYHALLSNISFLKYLSKQNINGVMSLVSSLIRELPVSDLHFTRSKKFLEEVKLYE